MEILIMPKRVWDKLDDVWVVHHCAAQRIGKYKDLDPGRHNRYLGQSLGSRGNNIEYERTIFTPNYISFFSDKKKALGLATELMDKDIARTEKILNRAKLERQLLQAELTAITKETDEIGK